MRLIRKQSGFSVVELLLIIVVIGILVFVGYFVYNKQRENKATSSSQSQDQSVTEAEVKEPPQVTTAKDLDTVDKALDDTSLDEDPDSRQLDAQLSEF
jgi:predicted negative regulator of RcsB-dependent stress response